MMFKTQPFVHGTASMSFLIWSTLLVLMLVVLTLDNLMNEVRENSLKCEKTCSNVAITTSKLPSQEVTMNLASRFNEGKPDLSYILTAKESLFGLAKVYEFGAMKYARDNWKRGLTYLTLVSSLMRHLTKFVCGEGVDEESGLPHVDHVLWNAQILSQMFHTRIDMDDRVNDKKP